MPGAGGFEIHRLSRTEERKGGVTMVVGKRNLKRDVQPVRQSRDGALCTSERRLYRVRCYCCGRVIRATKREYEGRQCHFCSEACVRAYADSMGALLRSTVGTVDHELPVIRVCDAIMGSGKTSAAIRRMLEDCAWRYIYITPYLDEVERIKSACAERDFIDPQNTGDGKLEGLHRLLMDGRNIVSTHALFSMFTETTTELIRLGGYKLILDEDFEAVEKLSISYDDLQFLINTGVIEVSSDGAVEWVSECRLSAFDWLHDACRTRDVILYARTSLFAVQSIETYASFEDVTILTYLFDAQILKYYFDTKGITVRRIGTQCINGEYRFSQTPQIPEFARSLKDKIHILDSAKLNAIGEDYYDLSSTWYTKNAMNGKLPKLRRNIGNAFRNIFSAPSGECLWTTFKGYEDVLRGDGYKKSFLSFNARATNEYRHRHYLAYCVNVFYDPSMKSYFAEHGVIVQEEVYALSRMIQWIWRSAIRDGGEIWIYLPSRRMRELLMCWMDDLQKGRSRYDT